MDIRSIIRETVKDYIYGYISIDSDSIERATRAALDNMDIDAVIGLVIENTLQSELEELVTDVLDDTAQEIVTEFVQEGLA